MNENVSNMFRNKLRLCDYPFRVLFRTAKMQIEIARKKSPQSDEDVVELCLQAILSAPEIIQDEKIIYTVNLNKGILDEWPQLTAYIDSISFSGPVELPITQENTKFFVYSIQSEAAETEYIGNEQSDEETSGASHYLLPTREFQGLWESLIFDAGVKEKFLHFVETTMLFSKRNVDQNVIACNRLALLHGPPGTGKTSLSKAVAQKLAIRMRDQFAFFHLIEINSHSLFSKWFSESGKLVAQLFDKIHEIIENPASLVCVLIDEVESIAYTRGLSAAEPTDAMRVVNAVLTQLDRIRKFRNVLVLSTSNVTSSIDAAFLDRADIVQFIGPPSVAAIYEMYAAALNELRRAEIIELYPSLLSFRSLEEIQTADPNAQELLLLAEISCGLSGRTVKKIPFLAHALYVQKARCSLEEFLVALKNAIVYHLTERKRIPAAFETIETQLLQPIDSEEAANGFSVIEEHMVNTYLE